MLHENDRMVQPADILPQVKEQNFEAIVVLGLGKTGEKNAIMMSTITVNELAMLTQQLQAHMTVLLGSMTEV